jgi:hypothetical protein
MSREAHVRICERPGARFPRATHLVLRHELLILRRQARQPQHRLVDRMLLPPLAAARRLGGLQRQPAHAAGLARPAGRAPLDISAEATGPAAARSANA